MDANRFEDQDRLAREVFTEQYLDELSEISPLNGASPNRGWLVSCAGEAYVLRQCIRNHDPDWLHYLEKLTEALIAHGFPIQPMIPSRDGRRTVFHADSYWQLRPYVVGRAYELGRESDEQEALRKLLQLHALPDLPHGPPNPNEELPHWIHHPDDRLNSMEAALRRCTDAQKAAQLTATHAKLLEQSLDILSPAVFDALPQVLTHGDFHGNNLLFQGDRIVMVLDFDTVEFRPRAFDLALAAYQLTRVRRGSFQLDQPRTRRFLQAYAEQSALSPVEWQAIQPLLQLFFLPTERYLDLMRTHTPHLLDWYLDWSLEAVTSARQFTEVIATCV